jgi:predicted amino acid dehydrogenase
MGPGISNIPPRVLEHLLPSLPPIRYVDIGPVVSLGGSEARGFALLCPLMPQHFVTLPSSRVKQKVKATVNLASRLGAKIVGLGGFTSVCCDEGREIVEDCDVAITSGNTLTAALAIQEVIRASKLLDLELENAKMAVIGATGDIGSAVTRVLAPRVAETVIAARNYDRLNEFAHELSVNSNSKISIVKYVHEAVREADIILTATNAVTTVIDPADLLPGAIVCDIAIPHNISREVRNVRNDILVFDGGIASYPPLESMGKKRRWTSLFPVPTQIYGCLAETIVLALDGRYENFSIGRGRITEDRISLIWEMSGRHGFSIGAFYCGESEYTPTDIARIKDKLRTRKRSLC